MNDNVYSYTFDLKVVPTFLIPDGKLILFPDPTLKDWPTNTGKNIWDDFIHISNYYGSLNPITVERVRDHILLGPEKTQEDVKNEIQKLLGEL